MRATGLLFCALFLYLGAVWLIMKLSSEPMAMLLPRLVAKVVRDQVLFFLILVNRLSFSFPVANETRNASITLKASRLI
jgi:hypothetical protein